MLLMIDDFLPYRFNYYLRYESTSTPKVSENECTKTKLTGRYLYDFEVMIQPRTRDGQVGSFVVTPFLTQDGNLVLVNRGWVPKNWDHQEDRSDRIVEIEAVLRSNETKSMFTPPNNPARNQWYWIDNDEIWREVSDKSTVPHRYSIVPVAFDLILKSSHPTAYPIPKDLTIPLKNDHLQYAITWYSLSVATLLMIMFRRRYTGRLYT
ncbi:SURF1 family-domain-containing protein [Paraphysoderma sedebokerense]|nr:SURF1 family-domain-containing protein [Paraphysoderma sedebokerense]